MRSIVIFLILASAFVNAGEIGWRAFDQKTFELAREKNRPVLLFVSSSCSFGGMVMEATTFRDTVVEAVIREHFMAVRIDRDARPDLDVRAQQAAKLASGVTGWPLVLLFTPEGDPIYAIGTCAADDDPALQRAGLRSVLRSVAESWVRDNGAVRRDAAEFTRALNPAATIVSLTGKNDVDLSAAVANATIDLWDRKAGGLRIGGESKFPTPRALDFCLTYFAQTKNEDARECGLQSLRVLTETALHDHVGGGFFTYCNDRWWRMPKLEKRLAENAEIIPALLHAWQLNKDETFRTAATRALRFWAREFDYDAKKFPNAIGASPDIKDEAAYYGWTVREVEDAIANNADCLFAESYFGIEERGTLGTISPGRSIPIRALTKTQNPDRVAAVCAHMLKARAARPSPRVDRANYVYAQCLMAAAFIECGNALANPEFTKIGMSVLDARFPERNLLQDDAAQLYALSFIPNSRARTGLLLEKIQANYLDKELNQYFDRARNPNDPSRVLDWTSKSVLDTSEPSSNGLLALACARLANQYGEPFKEAAEKLIESLSATASRTGPFAATIAQANVELSKTKK